MEPISITAACVGLISGLTAISTKINGVRIDVKNANKEILALQSELVSCQRSLSLFNGSGDADSYPENMQDHITTIIRGCRELVDEINVTLDKIFAPGVRQKLQWSIITREEVLRLHRSLECQKSALTIAISVSSLSVSRDIHSDTASIRGKASRIPEIQGQLSAIWDLLHGSEPEELELGLNLTMQRFLDENDTEILTGSTLTRNNTIKSYMASAQMVSDLVDDQSITGQTVVSRGNAQEDLETAESNFLQDQETIVLVPPARTDNRQNIEVLGLESPPMSVDMTIADEASPRIQYRPRAPLHPGITSSEPNSSTSPYLLQSAGSTGFEQLIESTSSPPSEAKRSFWKRMTPGTAKQLEKLGIQSEGRICVRNLELANLYLDSESCLNVDDEAYQHIAQLLRSYSHVDELACHRRFALTIRDHGDSYLQQPKDRQRTLVELGLVSESTMRSVEEEVDSAKLRSPVTKLRYLLLSAKELTRCEAGQKSARAYFAESKRDDELKWVLYEIANSFLSAYPTNRKAALPLARTFYSVAADMGDLRSISELASNSDLGIGGIKDRKAANVLRQYLNH